MIWHPLSAVLWAASVYASVLPLHRDDSLQVPVLNEASETSCTGDRNTVSAAAALPTVDLGYAKHKPVSDSDPIYYKFQNIRYAAPPTGDLRFRAPQPPLKNPTNEVEDGSGRKECLQATVKWAETFPDDNYDDAECCKKDNEDGRCEEPCSAEDRKNAPKYKKSLGALLPKNSLTDTKYYSEDCLFLDVWTTKDSFKKDAELLPVVVWIHGGAYIFGGKSPYLPGGLMDRAKNLTDEAIVFVSMNYRMGALGFAAGKDIAAEDINAGLLDQRQALQWVKEHIKKFGGDPDYVTLLGLSAGGGSVLHHLTAHAGKGDKLFKRAISLSGGWQPITNRTRAESTFQDFLKYNKVSSINELRKVSEAQIMKANYDQIYNSPPGSYSYNPTAWGDFTPESPSKLLEKGEFHSDIQVLASHASNESAKFISTFSSQKTTFEEMLNLTLPDLDADEREWVNDTYHYDQPDASAIGDVLGDMMYRCPLTYLSDAKYGYLYRHNWKTFRSDEHGGDLLYLFYQPLVPVSSVRSARLLQDYVIAFSTYGFPATAVQNPEGVTQPSIYNLYSNDKAEQIIDSTNSTHYPKVYREASKLEYVCRVWQSLSST